MIGEVVHALVLAEPQTLRPRAGVRHVLVDPPHVRVEEVPRVVVHLLPPARAQHFVRDAVPNRCAEPDLATEGAPCVSRDAESRFCIASRPSRRVFRRARPTSDPRRDRLRSRLTCARASAEEGVFVGERANVALDFRDVPGVLASSHRSHALSKIFLCRPPIRLKKPRGRPRDALPRATPRTGTTRVKCSATSPLALCARCVLARTPPSALSRARTFRVCCHGRTGNRIVCDPVRALYPASSRAAPLTRTPALRPRTPQTRALHTSARAFAADAPAVSLDDTAEAWATVKAAVATEDGQRAIAQLQKPWGHPATRWAATRSPVAPIDGRRSRPRAASPQSSTSSKPGWRA